MERVLVALSLGVRRLRARPLQAVGLGLAFAAAGAVIAVSSLTAALAHEENVELRLEEEAPAARALTVESRFTPLGEVPGEDVMAATLAGFARVAEPVRRLRVWSPIAPTDERGVHIVVAENQAAQREIVVSAGRLPGPCRGSVCEGLALAGGYRPGETIRLDRGLRLRITGTGLLTGRALADSEALLDRSVLVPSDDGALAAVLFDRGGSVYSNLVLDAGEVRGYELEALAEAMRLAVVRIEREEEGEALVRAAAPLDLLGELAARGRVARERLLLVAGQAAALILAFAAFAASARRADTRLLREQLATFGATRSQTLLARSVEIIVPAAGGTALALGGMLVAAYVAGRSDGQPAEFVSVAFPTLTIVAVIAFAALAAAIVLVGSASEAVQRRGVGPLEVAALAALGVVVWQTAATGALDPETVAGEGNSGPVLLLVPALTFFASAILLLRVLPFAFRIGERLARRSAFTLRLAVLSATRNPAQAAAATTFLAVALGTALFSLNYRTTLDEQAKDEARFRAGAPWRVLEAGGGGPQSPTDVSPLTRFARVTEEPPTPVLRLRGSVRSAGSTADAREVTVLALPAGHVPRVLGWRDGFSRESRDRIARRLREGSVRLGGPPLGGATAIRLWARAQTRLARAGVLHVLLPGQAFAEVPLGALGSRWGRLNATLPRSVRNGQVVGVEFIATESSFDPFDPGRIDFGRIELRQGDRWTRLSPIDDWVPTPPDFAAAPVAGRQRFPDGPIRSGIRFELNGTPAPLLRPPVPSDVPAMVGSDLASSAVDRTLELSAGGDAVTVRVVASARLFPTIVEAPGDFVVTDYDALFAALNVDAPGLVTPSEAWFFEPKNDAFVSALGKPPFRAEQVFSAERLERRFARDPLAAGARLVLGIAAVAAVLLGLVGLVLATRTALRDERTLIAEYEALGVPPRSLARSVQIRLATLSALGLAAGGIGGVLTVALIGTYVAVTASGARPLPSIEPTVAWSVGVVVLVGLAVAAVIAAAWIAGRDLRRSVAARLRG
jgi:hypothetical protein